MSIYYFAGILLLTFANFNPIKTQLDFVYHDHAALTQILVNYSITFPSKTYLYSIGKSVEGSISSRGVYFKYLFIQEIYLNR